METGKKATRKLTYHILVQTSNSERRRFVKMKFKDSFQILALLMAVLMFGMPFGTVAEQDSVQVEAGVATGSDGNAVILEAKAAAAEDASRDVNKLVWFGAGLVGASLIFGGAIGGSLIGGEIYPSSPSNFVCAPSGGQMGCTLAGAVVGPSIPLTLIYNYKPNLPPDRFIGKSPEYIDHYTEAYMKQARSIRMSTASAGCGLGCLLGLAG